MLNFVFSLSSCAHFGPFAPSPFPHFGELIHEPFSFPCSTALGRNRAQYLWHLKHLEEIHAQMLWRKFPWKLFVADGSRTRWTYNKKKGPSSVLFYTIHTNPQISHFFLPSYLIHQSSQHIDHLFLLWPRWSCRNIQHTVWFEAHLNPKRSLWCFCTFVYIKVLSSCWGVPGCTLRRRKCVHVQMLYYYFVSFCFRKCKLLAFIDFSEFCSLCTWFPLEAIVPNTAWNCNFVPHFMYLNLIGCQSVLLWKAINIDTLWFGHILRGENGTIGPCSFSKISLRSLQFRLRRFKFCIFNLFLI